MPKKINKMPKQKKGLHPLNPHRAPYDFPALIKSMPALEEHVRETGFGGLSIDFSNPLAVNLLNKALLHHFYRVSFWDIPKGYLCPPIPGRADYLHYLADVLAQSNEGKIPKGKRVKGLDIGMGANCIYPILGHRVHGWQFVGADIDPISIKNAKLLVAANPNLQGGIECRLQKKADDIFVGMIKPDDYFDFTMCNPPFHVSLEEAIKGNTRKVKNLAENARKKGSDTLHLQSHLKRQDTSVLNFGGQNAELFCPGGELFFVKRMIKESAQYAGQCFWFTTMLSKKENLSAVYQALNTVKAQEVRTIEMIQGQKITRILAWTFLEEPKRVLWSEKWKE